MPTKVIFEEAEPKLTEGYSPAPWRVVLGGCGDLAGVMSGDHSIFMLGRTRALNPANVALLIEAPTLLELVRDVLDDGLIDLLWQTKAEAVLQRIAEFKMPAEAQ